MFRVFSAKLEHPIHLCELNKSSSVFSGIFCLKQMEIPNISGFYFQRFKFFKNTGV